MATIVWCVPPAGMKDDWRCEVLGAVSDSWTMTVWEQRAVASLSRA